MEALAIDGSQGEGGGQILRSSLALSMITGRPVVLEKLRANRKKPGLQPQHLTAVNAARVLSAAKVDGAELGSRRLRFTPGKVSHGTYHFAVGTAGSATLVLQTVLPGLLLAAGPSRAIFEGGTHNPMAPPYDFIERVFLPAVGLMGPRVSAKLERHGFYPAGGGRFVVDVHPAPLRRLEVLQAGEVRARSARCVLARLADHIGARELGVVRERLGWSESECSVERVEAASPGNVLLLELQREPIGELVAAIGERGLRAEAVAELAVRELRAAEAFPVGPHLADQLLLIMALGGGGAFRTGPLTLHARTNIDVIEAFGVARFTVAEDAGGATVTVTPNSVPSPLAERGTG